MKKKSASFNQGTKDLIRKKVFNQFKTKEDIDKHENVRGSIGSNLSIGKNQLQVNS